MIEVICDKCKKNCGLNAYAIKVELIHNPAPTHPLDGSDIKLTDDTAIMRMILCQECFGKMGMPNIYTVQRTKKLDFKSEAAENDE